MGKRTDKLGAKIKAKMKIIAKHKEELKKLLVDYNGKEPDFL